MGAGRVCQVDGNHLDVTAEAVCKSATTQIQGRVANLLVDADALGDAFSGHPLPGDEAGLILGLADVDEHAEVGEHVATRVHRDNRDPSRHSALN